MKRFTLIASTLSILIAGCGKKKDVPANLPEAVVEKHRARAEARIAALRKFHSTLSELSKEPLRPVALGDRPKIDLPRESTLREATTGKPDVSNARLLASFDLEDPDQTVKGRPLSLLQDQDWLRNVQHQLKRPKGGGQATAVERDFEAFFRIRYAAVLVTISYAAPEARYDQESLQLHFSPGAFVGRLYVLDLEGGSVAGGVEIQATNSEKIDYSYHDTGDPRKAAQESAEWDLRGNIRKAARVALGGEVPAPKKD